MPRYFGRFECAEAGCSEVSHTQYSTRREQTESYRRYYKNPSRCVRHSQPQEVLSASHPKRVTEIVSKRHFTDSGADIGLFFNNFGFAHGPGFKVFAKDFPEGTKLIVTAEIVLSSPGERKA